VERREVAVAQFLTTKNRRASVPDAELYRDKEFVEKFLKWMLLFKHIVCTPPTET
jgi:hypothetical protein